MNKKAKKYKRKISGDNRKRLYDAQKERMVKLEAEYFKDHEKIQNQVKRMIDGEPSILQHYYMDFAMEIYRLLRTHKGQTLINELAILDLKWESRGLNADLLNEIKMFYVQPYIPLIPYWFGDWLYRQKLTFDNTASGTDLDDFPILVHLTNANFDFSHAAADGRDIRFKETDDGPFLKYEIEKWIANEAWIWVKVPRVDAGSNTDFIYMYYGSPTATDDQDPENVWDNNFVMVQHMKDKTTSTIEDSTQYDNDGTKKGADEPIETTDGKVGNAQDFDGIDDSVDCGSAVSINPNLITITVWFKTTDTKGGLVTKDDGTNRQWDILIHSSYDGKISGIVWNSVGAFRQIFGNLGEDVNDGAWHRADLSYDNVRVRLYVDGSETSNGALAGPIQTTAEPVLIGDLGAANWELDGIIDEVRISKIAGSADWIKASWKTQDDTFITYGPEEEK